MIAFAAVQIHEHGLFVFFLDPRHCCALSGLSGQLRRNGISATWPSCAASGPKNQPRRRLRDSQNTWRQWCSSNMALLCSFRAERAAAQEWYSSNMALLCSFWARPGGAPKLKPAAGSSMCPPKKQRAAPKRGGHHYFMRWSWIIVVLCCALSGLRGQPLFASKKQNCCAFSGLLCSFRPTVPVSLHCI